ncbi:nucleotidyltransferase domain-containing protein [uncultured Dubosiella sp.]|uniref:nucleotidyltransferase domain-containing protein n=2 Tax=uncultured Dubosiella sp. TaxID=1937011 RepID=UPI00259321A8|nr:nucleotidyltransferase domain-containing protein [uncultured Dubosiella sp.]
MKEKEAFSELVDRFRACESVEAIGLGGSRATGKADAGSDYDLYVYVRADIPIAQREVIFAGLFQIMEYDNTFWEREDDGVFTDGTPIDILYRRIDDLDQSVRHVVIDHQAQNAYTTCLWNNLLKTKILFDRHGRLAALQKKYTVPYPAELKENIVRRQKALLFDGLPNYAGQIKKVIARRDTPAINHRAAAFVESYFDLLFGLNGTTHPGEKRMLREAKKLPVVPEAFETDIESLFADLFVDFDAAIHDLERIERRLKAIL